MRNFRSSLSQRVLSEPLPVLHDFYTCTWVSTNQRCLLPFMRERCESEAAFVFSRMLGKFVRKFEYSLPNLSFTTSRHSVASIPLAFVDYNSRDLFSHGRNNPTSSQFLAWSRKATGRSKSVDRVQFFSLEHFEHFSPEPCIFPSVTMPSSFILMFCFTILIDIWK